MSEDFVDALDKLSVITKTEELKQSVHVAYKLREKAVANQECAAGDMKGKLNDTVTNEQVQLAQQLQSALIMLYDLALEHAHELTYVVGDQVMQRVTEVTTQLYDDLAVFISTPHVEIQRAVIENLTKTPTTIEQQEKLFDFNEVVVVMKTEECKERTTDITIEPTDLMTAKFNEILILGGESELKEGPKETSVLMEQVAYSDSTCAAAIMKGEQLAKINLLDERVVKSNVEVVAYESEALVPFAAIVPFKLNVAIDQIEGEIIDNGLLGEVVIGSVVETMAVESKEVVAIEFVVPTEQEFTVVQPERAIVDDCKVIESAIVVGIDPILKDNTHCDIFDSIQSSQMATIPPISIKEVVSIESADVITTEKTEQFSDKTMTDERAPISVVDIVALESEQGADPDQTLSKIGNGVTVVEAMIDNASEIVNKHVKDIKSTAEIYESAKNSDIVLGNFYLIIECLLINFIRHLPIRCNNCINNNWATLCRR